MADSENSVSERMRADWNQRAREDAHYYVAFGGRDQDEAGFWPPPPTFCGTWKRS